jgi:hypothetical protein
LLCLGLDGWPAKMNFSLTCKSVQKRATACNQGVATWEQTTN